jgi:transcriptional regulator with XRE-family HTH domain
VIFWEEVKNLYKDFEALLKDKNITPYKVSKETGIATSTLTEWKKGTYTPKVDKLMKIADYLGVALEELIKEEVKAG